MSKYAVAEPKKGIQKEKTRNNIVLQLLIQTSEIFVGERPYLYLNACMLEMTG